MREHNHNVFIWVKHSLPVIQIFSCSSWNMQNSEEAVWYSNFERKYNVELTKNVIALVQSLDSCTAWVSECYVMQRSIRTHAEHCFSTKYIETFKWFTFFPIQTFRICDYHLWSAVSFYQAVEAKEEVVCSLAHREVIKWLIVIPSLTSMRLLLFECTSLSKVVHKSRLQVSNFRCLETIVIFFSWWQKYIKKPLKK